MSPPIESCPPPIPGRSPSGGLVHWDVASITGIRTRCHGVSVHRSYHSSSLRAGVGSEGRGLCADTHREVGLCCPASSMRHSCARARLSGDPDLYWGGGGSEAEKKFVYLN